MRMTLLAAVTAAAALWAGTVSAQSVPCGADYVVQAGDTLSKIASGAYGETGSYQLIYSANAGTIGPNPALIQIGMQLAIPCLDGGLTPSTARAETIRQVETTALLPAPSRRQIRMMTASNWAPFHDQSQEQGGMLTEIANVAMSRVRGPDEYKIDWINDWSAHLQPLISDVAYDVSLSWFRPNCDKIEKLGEGSKFRCNNLDWSEPLYEQVIGYYTRADYPAPLSHRDLFGANLCRPAGYSNFMLEEFDLVEPNITFATPSTPDECFQGLADGSYDVVVLAVDVSDGVIATFGLGAQVVRHDALDFVATLHAVTSKNNPNGAAYLAVLDEGIREIKDSGEWFEIVRRHLAEHRAKQ